MNNAKLRHDINVILCIRTIFRVYQRPQILKLTTALTRAHRSVHLDDPSCQIHTDRVRRRLFGP